MEKSEYPPPYWDWGFWWRHLIKRRPGIYIGGVDNPYLLRWYLLPRNPILNVLLHKFLRSDRDEALHDHPWWFYSFILKGGYWEHREGKLLSARSWRPAGTGAFRKAKTAHRVQLEEERIGQWEWVEKPVWTIVITGPKIREWGFHCPKGWVHWKQFTHQDGCGE